MSGFRFDPAFCGSTYITRVCNRETLSGQGCGMPAAVHVKWRPDRGEHSFLCTEHAPELEYYRYYRRHKVGPYCGMPGAYFDLAENTCKLENNELPVRQELERDLLQPVGAS